MKANFFQSSNLIVAALALSLGACATETTDSTSAESLSLRRIDNAEYDATMRDLLGVSSTPAKSFIAGEPTVMTAAQFEQYFNAADDLVEQAFADSTLRAKIMSCTPTSVNDSACIGQVISAFGARAWRRPLDGAEVTRLSDTAVEAIAMGEATTDGVKQAVKTMLSSAPFLYRVEK